MFLSRGFIDRITRKCTNTLELERFVTSQNICGEIVLLQYFIYHFRYIQPDIDIDSLFGVFFY